MDWLAVLDRIRAGEDETTEFKEWVDFKEREAEKLAKAACAFANSEGGLIILGADNSGRIIGVPEDPERVQERLTGWLQTALNAPIPARLGRHRDPGGWVHWIEVNRYRGPEPMRVRGRVFVRRSRSSVEASAGELQELYNVFGFLLTEERVIPGAGVGDIDIDTFREFLRRLGLELIAEPQPDLVADLRNRGVVDEDQEVMRPTLYGLLCFGRQPQSFGATRSAWIELVSYAGTDRSSAVLLRGEGKGRVDEQVERATGWLQGLGTREIYIGLRRIDRTLVPLPALREGLVNAIAHRDYAILGSKILVEVFADRIDITSPGELPNHMREASALAGGHPRSRNELIANYFLVQGFMEMRGRGLPIIRRAMREFNGTEPKLENDRDARYVRLTLWLDQKASA